MTYSVKITKPAEKDVIEAYQYIVEEFDNIAAAERFVRLINEKIKSLSSNPHLFGLVRDDYLASKGFRVLAIKSYNIFYVARDKEKVVSIVRVLHGRRDWQSLLKTDIDEKGGY
jgi:plasmid stabilization system protein ParE